MNKQQIFNKIAGDIREVKIQGARNIAKAALQAYSLIPTKESKKKLISLRETEPMLEKVINFAESKKHKMKTEEWTLEIKTAKELANHLIQNAQY